MGLIDLKTDLKSLKYGKDTIGGGYSGQPYIQTPIPDSFNDLGANEDFILRGGANALGDAATDIRRLTKMFFDLKSPNGVLFIAKQNLLSQTAVRTQTSDTVNEGVYTPLNTLAQAGVVELGNHLNKQGVNPFIETGAYANSEILYSVKVKPTQLTEENRLAELYKAVNTDRSINNWNFSGFDLNVGPNVLTYDGGPNSILGAGKTNIRYSTFRTGKQNSQYVNNPDFFTGKNNQKSINADDKQVGGLQINPNKSWIKASGSILPYTNVNTPQTSSFDYRPAAYLKPSQESITGSDGYFYNPLLYAGISANESIYSTLLGVYDVEKGKRNNSGNRTYTPNVYKPGTLEVNSEAIGPNTWTPPQNTTIYNVTQGKNVSNTFFRSFPVSNINSFFPSTVFDDRGKRISKDSVYLTKDTPTGKDYLNSPTAPPGRGETNPSSPYANDTITYNQEDLLTANPTQYSPAIKEDFRKVLRQKNPNTSTYYADLGQLTNAPGYIDNNVGVKKQIGNPGQRKNKSYASYTKGVSYSGEIKALDKINASPIGTGVNAPEGGSNNDLVTFNITPFGGSETLNFRAFLGSFNDNYSSRINAQQYVGRGEDFYTYGGFTRKISLSWTVAALSKQELIPMYKKLSYLASNTAPIYKDGFMQGPLVTLTVGGYVNELPGYIDGLTLEMGEDSTWEIGIDDNGGRDKTVAQLTHIIKVSGFNFTPIPTYLPQKGAHFIDLWNGEKNLWSDNAVSLT